MAYAQWAIYKNLDLHYTMRCSPLKCEKGRKYRGGLFLHMTTTLRAMYKDAQMLTEVLKNHELTPQGKPLHTIMEKIIVDGNVIVFMEGIIFIVIHLEDKHISVDHFMTCSDYLTTEQRMQHAHNACVSEHLDYHEIRHLPYDWTRFKVVGYEVIENFVMTNIASEQDEVFNG